MSAAIHLRTLVAFAIGVALTVTTLTIFQAWQVDAAPGDADATFVSMTPCRLLDTRPAPDRVGPSGSFGTQQSRTIVAHGVNGECTIPTDAVGLSLNVTAVGATAPTFLTIWPGGVRPLASSLNPAPGQAPTPNAVVTKLAVVGSFDVFNLAGTVDVIVDVNGYYTNASLQELASRLAGAEARIATLESSRPFAVTARDPSETFASTAEAIVGVQVTAPVAGQVTTNSSTSTVNAAADVTVECSINIGGTGAFLLIPQVDFDYLQSSQIHLATSRTVLSGTRTFDIAAGAVVTYTLVCRSFVGPNPSVNVTVQNSVLTAVFTPEA